MREAEIVKSYVTDAGADSLHYRGASSNQGPRVCMYNVGTLFIQVVLSPCKYIAHL